jgi:uncharacterized protein with NRDE domain
VCTLIILRRPGHAWPVLLAANRDELAGRPARPPGRHWPDRPYVVGGLDLEAGGSWLAVNDDGVVAAVLNRRGSLGPLPGKRSRGELVLDALDHADANQAALALAALEPSAYRPFNLIVADAERGFWLRHAGDGAIRLLELPDGLSVIDAGELNDPTSARLARIRFRFEAVPAPEPELNRWQSWESLLGERGDPGDDPRDGLCIVTDGAYGTRSSAVLALPPYPSDLPVWRHADGPPDSTGFEPVTLAG